MKIVSLHCHMTFNEMKGSLERQSETKLRMRITDSYQWIGSQLEPSDLVPDTHGYGYDADGNMTHVETCRRMADGTERGRFHERRLLWDYESRMKATCDNGYVTTYVYDADGNRTLKQTGGSLHLYGGSRRLSGETDTEPFTLYVGPWMTANDRGVYTKHVYAGAERIVSKIVNDSVYFNDDLTVEKAGDGMNPSVDYGRITSALSGRTKAIYDELEIPYRGLSDAERKTTAQSAAGKAEAVARTKAGPETARFFYHPDHLGSSSFITDAEGKVVQHLEYVPYGEVFLDERTGGWNAPYLFNAKELDEETGLYYYGARYYDPRLSLWLSTDPMAMEAPNLSPYRYGLNNPVNFIDPYGLFESETEAKKWAKDNGIKTGFLRNHKIQQQEGGIWAIVNQKENYQYTRDHSLDCIQNVLGRDENGVIQSIVVYANKSSLVAAEISYIWNSRVARWIIPDIISVGGGFSGIFGIGASSSIELNWIIRGPEASLKPILSVSEYVGTGFSVDATFNFGGSVYLGPVSCINRRMVSTSIAESSVGGFLSFGLTEFGKVGVTISSGPAGNGVLVNGQLNIGPGFPMGPVPVNGAFGAYNTYVIKDFYK